MNEHDRHRKTHEESAAKELTKRDQEHAEDWHGEPDSASDESNGAAFLNQSGDEATEQRKSAGASETGEKEDFAADSTIVSSMPGTLDNDRVPSENEAAEGITVEKSQTRETPSTATAHETAHTSYEVEEGEQQRSRVVLQAGTDEQSLRALALCREKVKQLRLRMRPLAARWEGDKHVIIFFRADEKVDFRKLVRELSRLLHARIELRQVGPREQGKLCGLVGKCGYSLCCQTFLGQLAQSTIKMAKTQDLALNPMKISGVCGRLLCCLNYEQEMYVDAKSRMPKVNRIVDTDFGPGKVVAVNVLKGTVTVQLETMVRELRPDQVQLPETHG